MNFGVSEYNKLRVVTHNSRLSLSSSREGRTDSFLSFVGFFSCFVESHMTLLRNVLLGVVVLGV